MGDLSPGRIRELKFLPNPDPPAGTAPPRQLDPEPVPLPDLPEPRRFVSLPGEVEPLARLLEGDAEHGLSEADPPRRVGLLRHEVVALGGVPHRQDIIGEPRRFTPYRR